VRGDENSPARPRLRFVGGPVEGRVRLAIVLMMICQVSSAEVHRTTWRGVDAISESITA